MTCTCEDPSKCIHPIGVLAYLSSKGTIRTPLRDVCETADHIKALGNQLYADKQYKQAADVYNAALALLGFYEGGEHGWVTNYAELKRHTIITEDLKAKVLLQGGLLLMNIGQALMKVLDEELDEVSAMRAVMVCITSSGLDIQVYWTKA